MVRSRIELPAEYRAPFEGEFRAAVAERLRPGMTVLDVGGGLRPTVLPEARPADVHYVGLDLSLDQLRGAPAGSYDELVAADIVQRQPALEDRFDLIVSFQVLEHVKPLSAAFANMHAYLRPGGSLVVQFSGKFSLFGLANQAVPWSLARWFLRRFTSRRPENTFPAHYDRCWHGALTRLLATGWDEVQITPLYTGAGYFRFHPLALRAYLAYEDWTRRAPHPSLAPYYVVTARRAA